MTAKTSKTSKKTSKKIVKTVAQVTKPKKVLTEVLEGQDVVVKLVDAPAKKAPAKAAHARVTILEHSATSFLKYLGREGFSTAQATRLAEKLASAPLAASTIATGLSDGKNPKYNTNAAALSESDIAKIVKLVGKGGE